MMSHRLTRLRTLNLPVRYIQWPEHGVIRGRSDPGGGPVRPACARVVRAPRTVPWGDVRAREKLARRRPTGMARSRHREDPGRFRMTQGNRQNGIGISPSRDSGRRREPESLRRGLRGHRRDRRTERGLRTPSRTRPGRRASARSVGGVAATSAQSHDPHEVTVQLDGVGLQLDRHLRKPRARPAVAPTAPTAPVFVDESGRRSRRFRRIGIAVGMACAVYAVVIVVTLLSGNSNAPWLPVPGQKDDKPAGKVDTTSRPADSARPAGTGPARRNVVPGPTPTASDGTTPSPGASGTAHRASPPAPAGPGASADPGGRQPARARGRTHGPGATRSGRRPRPAGPNPPTRASSGREPPARVPSPSQPAAEARSTAGRRPATVAAPAQASSPRTGAGDPSPYEPGPRPPAPHRHAPSPEHTL